MDTTPSLVCSKCTQPLTAETKPSFTQAAFSSATLTFRSWRSVYLLDTEVTTFCTASAWMLSQPLG